MSKALFLRQGLSITAAAVPLRSEAASLPFARAPAYPRVAGEASPRRRFNPRNTPRGSSLCNYFLLRRRAALLPSSAPRSVRPEHLLLRTPLCPSPPPSAQPDPPTARCPLPHRSPQPSPQEARTAAAAGSPLSRPPLPARCVRTQGAVEATARRSQPPQRAPGGAPHSTHRLRRRRTRVATAPRPISASVAGSGVMTKARSRG